MRCRHSPAATTGVRRKKRLNTQPVDFFPWNSTNALAGLCFAPHVSRTDEKGAIALGRVTDARPDDGRDSDEGSGVKSTAALGLPASLARSDVPCESERTRLIAELTRLIREPTVPENTRLAGLTLIGWLARRRCDELPHAIGIEEARQSERRMRATRGKPR
jgi:hypothetical protein